MGFSIFCSMMYFDFIIQLFIIFGFSGEMVYWLFDYFMWFFKVGVFNVGFVVKIIYILLFGESVGYIFFIIIDVIFIK